MTTSSDLTIGPTVPTPKTPISMSTVDDGHDFESHIQQQQQHSSSSSTTFMNNRLAKRLLNFFLRAHPAILLTFIPLAMVWSGLYAPGYFYAWCITYNLYSVYIIGYICYHGFGAMRKARKSRSINFYQKYLQKQKTFNGNNNNNNMRKYTSSNYGEPSSSSSSSDEEEGHTTNTRFTHRMRQMRNKGERNDDQWNKVVHFVIIPNFNERESILRQSLNSLAQQSIARKQIIPVLAMEQRETNVEAKAKRLASDYGLQFRDVLYTIHPSGMPEETPGKGSNSNYAFHNGVRDYVESRSNEIDPNYVVVTVQDADSIYHENHFDSLTYAFLVSHMHGSNNTSIWQAPMVCYRNFNEIPGFTRVLALLITLHELAALSDESFENISFSTYSSSYVFVLNAMNGWCPKYITEDWHFTIRAFFNSGGLVRVYGLPFPISCYSTQADTYWNTIYERIIQAKRHTLVFTEFPYILKRVILTYIHGTSVPAYVQPNFHKIQGGKANEVFSPDADLEEQDIKKRLPKTNWSRMLRLLWNVTSVNYIGGTQLTVVLMSFLFSQYHSYLYNNSGEATTNDSVYWAAHLWIPLLNLSNFALFCILPVIVYLNDKLISYVNGKEYQSKYWMVRHWCEWWLFSALANFLLVIGPTYHTAFEMIFKDRYVFERSLKPEAPHLFRKKKSTPQKRNSRKKSNATLTIITDVLRNTPESNDEFVIDVAATTSGSRKKVGSANGHTRSESNSTDSIASNSCSEDSLDEMLSDSSMDSTSPVTSNAAVALVRERSHSGAGVETKQKFDSVQPLIRHVSTAATSKKNVKVEVVVALR